MQRFAALLEEIDLSRLSWTVTYVFDSISSDPKSSDLVIRLLKKWKTIPSHARQMLMNNLRAADGWTHHVEVLAELWDALLPADGTEPQAWHGLSLHWHSTPGQLTVTSPVIQLMDRAAQQNVLHLLYDRIESAVAKHPRWPGGQLLKGILLLRMGRAEEARPIFEKLVADKTLSVTDGVSVILLEELVRHEPFHDLCTQLLTRYDGEDYYAMYISGIFQRLGKRNLARNLLLKTAYGKSANRRLSDSNSRIGIADRLHELGYAVDALQLYVAMLGDTTHSEQPDELRQRYDRLFRQVGAEEVRGLIKDALRTATAPDSEAPGKIIQLGLSTTSPEVDKVEIRTSLAVALALAEKHPAAADDALGMLAELRQQHPKDFSIRIAAALFAFAGSKTETAMPIIKELSTLVEATPLANNSPQGPWNEQQREEANRQVPLWLAARECLKHASLRRRRAFG